MARFDKKILMNKYRWNGRNVSELMEKILSFNRTKIAEAVLTSDRRRFERNLKIIEPKFQEKKIVIPDVGNVIRKSPTIIKAAERGKLIADTLRERIRKDIKAAMLENGVNNKNGTVNKNVTRSLRAKLNTTFNDYTRKDPTFKTPTNIEAIAVTETRTVMNTVRNDYAKEVSQNTQKDGFSMVKTWQHNRSPGGMPRKSHEALDGKTIGIEEKFTIMDNNQTYLTEHPHSPVLPASQTITCRCELLYRWQRVRA